MLEPLRLWELYLIRAAKYDQGTGREKHWSALEKLVTNSSPKLGCFERFS